MGVYIANNQGTIGKAVNSLHIADAEGNIDKEIESGYAADNEGAIDKLFYENWVYYTSDILHSSSGGGYLYTTYSLTPNQLAYDIKLEHIQTGASIQTVDGGVSATVKLEVRYLDESDNWVTLKYTTKTVEDTAQSIYLSFDVSPEIITKQLQYRLIKTSGETVSYSSFYGKCTAWYKKG